MMSAARLGAATGTASRFGCGAMSVRGGGTCRGAAAGKEGGRWGHGGWGALGPRCVTSSISMMMMCGGGPQFGVMEQGRGTGDHQMMMKLLMRWAPTEGERAPKMLGTHVNSTAFLSF